MASKINNNVSLTYFKGIFSDLRNKAFMSIDPLTVTASKEIDRTATPYSMFIIKYIVSIIKLYH